MSGKKPTMTKSVNTQPVFLFLFIYIYMCVCAWNGQTILAWRKPQKVTVSPKLEEVNHPPPHSLPIRLAI